MELACWVTEKGEGGGMIDAGSSCLCHMYSESPSFHLAAAAAGFITITGVVVPLSLEIYEKKPDPVLFVYIMVRSNTDHGADKLADAVYVPGGVLLVLVI